MLRVDGSEGLADGFVAGDVVVNLAGKYDQIMVAATTTGKNFMPRVAAILDMAQIQKKFLQDWQLAYV